ncbi:MAG: hypothetical protein HFH45_03155 [Bacilli bacterium]|jgi:hypothetical protein|nr:hypothetical protein [Bacilli bacterium]
MSQKKKNNIIIGSLCAVVLLMAVGYATFNSMLNINGTSKITSEWNIHFDSTKTSETIGVITGIKGPVKGPVPSGTVTYADSNLTANLTATLNQPGDKVVYNLTVLNEGTLNAKLDNLNVTASDNPAIKFEVTGLKVGDKLNAGDSAIITVTIEYDSSITSQPESTTATTKVTINFVQDTDGGEITPPTNEKVVYRYSMDEVRIGDTLDSLNNITDDYNTLGHNVFIKHTIVDEKVSNSEVCFVKNGLHCLSKGEYETTKTTLTNLFGTDACEIKDTATRCENDNISVLAIPEGDIYLYSDAEDCDLMSDGSTQCFG